MQQRIGTMKLSIYNKIMQLDFNDIIDSYKEKLNKYH
jgi:hypothetical protein